MRPNVSGGDQFEDNITHWCCSTALYPMSSGSISVSNTTEGPQASRFKIQTASPLNLPKFSKLAALLLILAEEGGILSPCDQYRKLVPQKFDLMCNQAPQKASQLGTTKFLRPNSSDVYMIHRCPAISSLKHLHTKSFKPLNYKDPKLQ